VKFLSVWRHLRPTRAKYGKHSCRLRVKKNFVSSVGLLIIHPKVHFPATRLSFPLFYFGRQIHSTTDLFQGTMNKQHDNHAPRIDEARDDECSSRLISAPVGGRFSHPN
jgi:hypothetical protein